VYEHFQSGIGKRGKELAARGPRDSIPTRRNFPRWPMKFPAWRTGSFPTDGTRTFHHFPADAKGLATRDSSGKVENAIAKNVPWFFGGSADLAPSTKTLLSGVADFEAEIMPDEICTSASASTPWPRSSMA